VSIQTAEELMPECESMWNDAKVLKSKHKRYELQVIYEALRWFELLNYFEFGDTLYFFFYTLVGAVTVFEGIVVWGLNRLLTKLRHPPIFHGGTLFYTIAEAPACVRRSLFFSSPSLGSMVSGPIL
jgi:hypothetical protein